MSLDQKRALISPTSKLSIACQCDLLRLARSTYYHKPTPVDETEWMNLIADVHRRKPQYGYRKVTIALINAGHAINNKKVRRLMRVMGMRSLLPKPRTSVSNKESPIAPYLLKDLKVTHVNQVWSTDLTYIRLPVGMAYLFALIDFYSRYIIGWKLAVTMEADHAISAFQDGLRIGCPEICNADQGTQFTGEKWIEHLMLHDVQISHTGVGRCLDNVWIERFWWTLKYEDIHLSAYGTVCEARTGIAEFIKYYNEERPHQALRYKTPFEVYFGYKASKNLSPQDPLALSEMKDFNLRKDEKSNADNILN